ncbi:MAG: hypothetical protein JXA03_16190 [Bacteroidales bacterium]|nr:hypothetical protein [Bacteroidales bacterium]
MSEWWASLDSFEVVFWYIAIPFSVILIIQMVLTFAGMGGSDSDIGGGETDVSGLDLETEPGADITESMDTSSASDTVVDMDPSFHFFTIRNFIAFFTLFGWGGIAAWNEGASRPLTIIIAVAAGLFAMVIITTLFYFISKLQDSGGGLRVETALHQTGNVYIPIKAKGGNVGQVQIPIQGSIREMQAITRADEDLKTGTVVKVVGIVSNSILVVEKAEK